MKVNHSYVRLCLHPDVPHLGDVGIKLTLMFYSFKTRHQCYKHRKAVLLESVHTEISITSNPNPLIAFEHLSLYMVI